jgi:GDP-L-fucose synthase
MVGSAIRRWLEAAGYRNIIGHPSSELDLTNQSATTKFLLRERPEYASLSAAKVGGIHANNTYPAKFIYPNLTAD